MPDAGSKMISSIGRALSLLVLTFLPLSLVAAEFAYHPINSPIANATGTLTGDPLPELEYIPPDESTIVGGNFVACAAYGRGGGKCYDYGTYYTRDGVERKACLGVTFNAYCSCDTVTGATKGNCTYR